MQVWLSPAAELMRPDASPPFTMVGFVAGARSKRVAALPHAEIARRLLLQLDAMFGSASDPTPATSSCDGYVVKDWADHPFTYGAYSHPTVGADGVRQALASPVHGVLLFAGEATHEAINPCLQGAMETGEKAAGLALELLAEVGSQPAAGSRSRL